MQVLLVYLGVLFWPIQGASGIIKLSRKLSILQYPKWCRQKLCIMKLKLYLTLNDVSKCGDLHILMSVQNMFKHLEQREYWGYWSISTNFTLAQKGDLGKRCPKIQGKETERGLG